MPEEGFSIVYQGNIVHVDLLKSILEGSGIQCVLEDEFFGTYAVAGGVKVLVPNDDFDKARQIVEKFLTRPNIRLVE
jgi:hypothetical protein